MPEGDTIHRTARTLDRALKGRTIVRATALDPRLRAGSFVGRRVHAVEARGKHLLIHFDDGRAVHSHMGMTGAWHIYRPGERWQLPEHLARLVLATDAFVAVCFRAPSIDIVASAAGGGARDARVTRLGPDIVAEEFDREEALRRLRARGDAPVGDALLDQTAVAGIGNIYRLETLFIRRIHPDTPVSALADDDLAALVDVARRLMRKNLDAPRRMTTREGGGPPHWVYRRVGRPCLVCGGAVRSAVLGALGRTAYFCPRCQSATGGA